MAARSLISLYRTTQPELLHKKDRGRPTEALVEANAASRKFGETNAKDFIPGAEVIEKEEAAQPVENTRKRKRVNDESEDESDWEEVYHSDDQAEKEEENVTSLEERK